MDEATHRKWDIIFKWFGLVGVLAGGWWTVYTYRHSRDSELEQQKYTQKKDEEARTKEQNSFIFQHQANLYFEAARTAATLATALDPASDDRRAMGSSTLAKDRERFEQLYWGELVVVEDRRVEMAMVAFRSCLQNHGKKCERPQVNQHGQPIDPTLLKKVGEEATLSRLALELAACTRSALQEDRKIQFGAVQVALSVCPYD